MRALLLAVLLGCSPQYVCDAPCHGQSAQEEREAGIVCYCLGNGAVTDAAPPPGASILFEQPGILAVKFEWTQDEDRCGAYDKYWSLRAPMPCAQPGGGKVRQNP